MLNKTAEKVLRCVIKKSKGNLEQAVHISCKDFKDKKITNSFINLVCRQLKEEEYIYNAYLSCDEKESIEIYLSHKGFSYFDNKKTINFKYWIPVVIANIIAFAALVISIISLLK